MDPHQRPEESHRNYFGLLFTDGLTLLANTYSDKIEGEPVLRIYVVEWHRVCKQPLQRDTPPDVTPDSIAVSTNVKTGKAKLPPINSCACFESVTNASFVTFQAFHASRCIFITRCF